MNYSYSTLKKCPLFFGIEQNSLNKMLTCMNAKVEHFEKKSTVFSEGSPAENIGIVLKGSIQMIQLDYYGNRSILKNIESSEVFGEAFSCSESRQFPVTFISNEPSDIMFVNCDHILHFCSNHCEFHQQLLYNLVKNLANETMHLHQKAGITSRRTTREKLLAYLMYCSKNASSSTFDIPFDRQELADYLEVDRSGLSAEIGKLRAEGVIKNTKNHFTLL